MGRDGGSVERVEDCRRRMQGREERSGQKWMKVNQGRCVGRVG